MATQMFNAGEIKRIDAMSTLTAALTSTAVTKLLLSSTGVAPFGSDLLGSFVQFGGLAVLSEEISDLISPRIESYLKMQSTRENYAVRALVAGGLAAGATMLATGAFSPYLFASGALGSIAATYVWEMEMSKRAK